MTIATELMYDATGVNVGLLPSGQHAGYITGSGTVPWTRAQLEADPTVVQIDQSPTNTALDETADILDVETGAATFADAAPWAKAASANFINGVRPGQRAPAIYVDRVNVTPLVNALIAGGVAGGVGLWVADWNNSQAEATGEVENAGGLFPIIGRQFHTAGVFDVSVMSVPWLTRRSVAPDRAQPPPGQWADPHAWTWAQAFIFGLGMDGRIHGFGFASTSGTWIKVM